MIHGQSYMRQTKPVQVMLNQDRHWWSKYVQPNTNARPDLELNTRFLIPAHRVYPDAMNALVYEMERQMDKIMEKHSPLRIVRIEQQEFRRPATDRTEYVLKVRLMQGRPANDFLIQDGLSGFESYRPDAEFVRNDISRAYTFTGRTLYGRSQVHLEAGRFHRIDGPACIHPCGNVEWMLHGQKQDPRKLRQEEGIEVLPQEEHRYHGSWFRSDTDAFLFAMLADRTARKAK